MRRPRPAHFRHRTWWPRTKRRFVIHPSQPLVAVPLKVRADQGKRQVGRMGRQAPHVQTIRQQSTKNYPAIGKGD